MCVPHLSSMLSELVSFTICSPSADMLMVVLVGSVGW